MAQLALDRAVRPERQARGDDRRDERDGPAEGSHEREQERHDEHDGTDARRYHQARAAIDTLAVAEVSALARDEIAHGTSVARPVGGQRDENNGMLVAAGAASCARSLGFLVVWLLGGALAPQSGASGEQDEPHDPHEQHEVERDLDGHQQSGRVGLGADVAEADGADDRDGVQRADPVERLGEARGIGSGWSAAMILRGCRASSSANPASPAIRPSSAVAPDDGVTDITKYSASSTMIVAAIRTPSA